MPKNPCKECRARIQMEHRKRDRDADRRIQKDFLERHPGYQQKWKEANRERLRELAKVRRERNLDTARAYAREHRKQYADARKARKKGQFVESIKRQVVYDTHKGICGICQNPIFGKFHVDHIIPLSRGGEHSYANVQLAHPKCNRTKSNKLCSY